MSDYPEHTKITALMGKNNTIGDFLEWLTDSGHVICLWDHEAGELVPRRRRAEAWIADYFGIDPVVIEKEKRLMIDRLRQEADRRRGESGRPAQA